MGRVARTAISQMFGAEPEADVEKPRRRVLLQKIRPVLQPDAAADSYQLKQVEEFLTWCAGNSVKSGHLFGQHE